MDGVGPTGGVVVGGGRVGPGVIRTYRVSSNQSKFRPSPWKVNLSVCVPAESETGSGSHEPIQPSSGSQISQQRIGEEPKPYVSNDPVFGTESVVPNLPVD